MRLDDRHQEPFQGSVVVEIIMQVWIPTPANRIDTNGRK
jgi:hypothetical protein